MPKLPPVSGRDVVRGLLRLGFAQTGQRGSHVKLRRGSTVCIVPLHHELKRGTLSGILGQADVTAAELLEAMAQ